MPTKRAFLRGLAASLLPCGPGFVRADTWPTHPLTMIAPFPAGGPIDVLARLVSERMRQPLGQSVIVDNVSGAGGTIGVAKVAHAAPDGYTLGIGNVTSHVFAGAAYKVNYDALVDLEPVALLTMSPLWLIGRKDLPAATVGELVTWLKANPGKGSFASVGTGGPSSVWTALFKEKTGADFEQIPYRGAAPALQDMVAGRVDFAELEASNTLPYVKGGEIKAFAVLSGERWRIAPDVPTIDEAGLPGLQMPYWSAVWVPKGTPKEIVARLNAAIVEALADPTVHERLVDLGQEIPPADQQTPAALGARQRADIEKWWPIMKAANIRSE
jgi:tripartite-type tricarboxylate transporter receptor subunit TctC